MTNSPDDYSRTPPKSNIFSISNTMTRSIKRINRKFKKVKNIVLINDINEKQKDEYHQLTHDSKSSNSGSKSSSFQLICQHESTQHERNSRVDENGLFIKKFIIKCSNCLFQNKDDLDVPKEFVNKLKFIQSDALIDRLFDMKSLLSSSN